MRFSYLNRSLLNIQYQAGVQYKVIYIYASIQKFKLLVKIIHDIVLEFIWLNILDFDSCPHHSLKKMSWILIQDKWACALSSNYSCLMNVLDIKYLSIRNFEFLGEIFHNTELYFQVKYFPHFFFFLR